MTDEAHEEFTKPWDQLTAIVESGDAEKLSDYLKSLPPGEPARALSRMSKDEQAGVLETLPETDAADLLTELPGEQAAQLVEELPVEEAAVIVGEIESHAQVELLARIDHQEAVAILDHMEPDEAENVRALAAFPRDTAGGLMITEYVAYPEDARVEEVLDDLRTHSEKYARYDIQYAYVVSVEDHLVGVLRLRDLLLASLAASIRSIMIEDPIAVPAATGLEDLQRLFGRHAFYGIPVIGEDRELVGVVRRSDMERAAEQQANRALLKFTGIVGGEELRSMPFLLRSRRRLSWLSINVLLNVLAASVIAWYQDTLAAVITLAVFLPIISDMSGCSGNQAVAVSMRELVLGLIKPREHFRVLWKEATLGLLNGLVLGAVLGGVAFLWKENVALSLVVGVALAINTVLSVCLGGTIPLLLRRANQDPALASGPILTTLTDMCGFFLVLSIAQAAMPWLAGY